MLQVVINEPLEATRHRRNAFNQYVVPELDVLYRVALTLTQQPADAEDLVQDTLVRAYRAVDNFDGRAPRAWLLTIMRHAERNNHRRRRPSLLDDPTTTWERHSEPAAKSPEDVVLDDTLDAALEAALGNLTDKYRHVIELVDVNGLSYKEAAHTLGLKEGTVMSRLHRGRSRIRAQLPDGLVR